MLRKGRSLAGYLPRDQGVNLLVQGPMAEGTPDPEAAAIQWERVAQAVRDRDPVEISDPLLPLPPQVTALADSFAARPDIQSTFAQHNWTVALADLTQSILSYQVLVQTDDALDRTRHLDANDLEALFQFCLPGQEAAQVQGGFDPTQNAFTATSLNPNLRLAGFQVVTPPNGGPTNNVIGFTLSLGSNQVQLVEYRGRWMVRDGYHRLYGLLARGITTVPCIAIRARSLDETGAGRPGFFNYETLYSERPPLLSDFLSDHYSVETWTQAVRKIVRIQAQEFVVPI